MDNVRFDGNNTVLVTFPKDPEMLVWVQKGPTGDIPEQMLHDAVDHLIAESTGARDAAEGFASDAANSAIDADAFASEADADRIAAESAATTATNQATAADTARTGAEAARTAAETAENGAVTARGQAEGFAQNAQLWAESFDVTVGTTSTGEPGTPANVTVTGDGPEYQLSFSIPRGDKGDPGAKGDPGEVTQAMLDTAVASLVGSAPEALDTLEEFANALGNNPNFATTVSTEIGLRAKTADVNDALAGKADSGAENTAQWSQVSGKPSTFPSTIPQVSGLQSALDNAGSNDAADLTGSLTSAVNVSNAEATAPGSNVTQSLSGWFDFVANLYDGFVMLDNAKLDKSSIQVVSSLPGSPDPGTFYFVTES